MSSCFAIKGFEIPEELYTVCDITECWCHILIVTRMSCFVTHTTCWTGELAGGFPFQLPLTWVYLSGGGITLYHHDLILPAPKHWPSKPLVIILKPQSNFFLLSFLFVEPQACHPWYFFGNATHFRTILRNAIRGRLTFTIFHRSYSIATPEIKVCVVERKWKSTKHIICVWIGENWFKSRYWLQQRQITK